MRNRMNEREWTKEDILSVLPHREPFLFVDRVIRLSPSKSIIAEREIQADEFFFRGHFPQQPIMPGVLVTDALAQTSGLLWGLSRVVQEKDTTPTPRLFYLAASTMKYKNPAYPEDVLRLESRTENEFGSLFTYAVEAYVGKKTIASGTLTLAMVEEKE